MLSSFLPCLVVSAPFSHFQGHTVDVFILSFGFLLSVKLHFFLLDLSCFRLFLRVFFVDFSLQELWGLRMTSTPWA